MAPRYFLGVDPGLSGALAFYDPAADELIVHDMPVHTITINRTKKRRLDLYALGMMLDALRNDTARAMVEDVGAMPKQGVASTFAFGFAAGAVQAAIASNIIPMALVRPAQWKRSMGLTSDKDASRRHASMLLPRHAHLWSRAKDDGRAEAALLSYLCAHKNV